MLNTSKKDSEAQAQNDYLKLKVANLEKIHQEQVQTMNKLLRRNKQLSLVYHQLRQELRANLIK